MDQDTLWALVEQLAANQAIRQQQLAEYEAQNRLLLTMFDQRGFDPILVKVMQVMAILRAADQMSANAVQELTAMVDERRREQS